MTGSTGLIEANSADPMLSTLSLGMISEVDNR